MRKKAFPDPAKPPKTLMSFFSFSEGLFGVQSSLNRVWGGPESFLIPIFPTPSDAQDIGRILGGPKVP